MPQGGATVEAGRGNDFIHGSEADDTYVYRNGDGHDVIEEDSYSENDELNFADIARSDIVWMRRGDDLIGSVQANVTTGSVAGSVTLRNAFNYSEIHDLWVEETVTFADGGSVSVYDLLDEAENGPLEVEDVDFTQDSNGNKSFLYQRGSGDRVIDVNATGSGDVLALQDVERAEVSFQRHGMGLKVHIVESSVGAGDGAVILLDDFVGGGVQKIRFADGSELRAPRY